MKPLSDLPKNCVVAVTRSVFILQLVNEAEINQTADQIKELAKISHAHGAVDIAVIVANTDVHSLAANSFFGFMFQEELIRNFPLEIAYLFTDDQDCFHCVSPLMAHYVIKHARSVAA